MPRSSATLVLALGLAASGCTAHRLALPAERPIAQRGAAEVVLTRFHVTNLSSADVEDGDGPRRWAELFLAHVAATRTASSTPATSSAPATSTASVSATGTTSPPGPIEVDLFVSLEDTDARTYLFDALFIYPGCGLFPFTPEWGEAIVRAEMRVRRPGRPETQVEVSVSAPYSAIFYAWYRTAPREDAFRRAHGVVVATLARELSGQPSDTPTVILPPDSAGVLFRPRELRDDGSLVGRYLSRLGGLEAGLTRGRATVRSRAVTQSGARQTVGSGRALSSGYRISLFKPPETTGYFFPPNFGYLSQSIDIRGFRDDIPLFVPEGTLAIPAVARDPDTGERLDLSDPLAYGLRLRSFYLGQGAGLNLVLGNEDLQIFSTLGAGLNLVEVRHTRVRFNGNSTAGTRLAFLRSGNLGADLGFAVPALHFALRASVRLEWYAAFNFPERLEFLAQAAYQPAKQVFERERTFVEGASLLTIDGLISAVVLF